MFTMHTFKERITNEWQRPKNELTVGSLLSLRRPSLERSNSKHFNQMLERTMEPLVVTTFDFFRTF